MPHVGIARPFVNNNFDSLHPDLTYLIIPIPDTEKLISELLHQPPGSLLPRFQVSICFHILQHRATSQKNQKKPPIGICR